MSLNAAVISSGVVANIIVVETLDFLPNLIELPEGSSVGIGWRWIAGQFSPPEDSTSVIITPTN